MTTLFSLLFNIILKGSLFFIVQTIIPAISPLHTTCPFHFSFLTIHFNLLNLKYIFSEFTVTFH
jgi:hypothetical protein